MMRMTTLWCRHFAALDRAGRFIIPQWYKSNLGV